MKKQEEKIDILLRRNMAEQLAGVDWDKLSTAISGRLDKAQQRKTSAIGLPTVLKIAAPVAAAAAVVFVMVMIKPERTDDTQWGEGRTATVKLTGSRGSASVAIIDPADRAHAQVDIAGKNGTPAKCYVRIIDSSTGQKEDGIRPSWFMISKAEPAHADNGANQDVMAIIYLF